MLVLILNFTDEFLFGSCLWSSVPYFTHLHPFVSAKKTYLWATGLFCFSLSFFRGPRNHVTDDVSLFGVATRKLTETHLMLCLLPG